MLEVVLHKMFVHVCSCLFYFCNPRRYSLCISFAYFWIVLMNLFDVFDSGTLRRSACRSCQGRHLCAAPSCSASSITISASAGWSGISANRTKYIDSVWCNCPNLEHAETFFESFPALGHTNRVSVGHLILCAFKTCQTQSWLQSITVESPILQYFASFCPQILTFCEAERYPMATCHDHWPRLEVQRETLLGDDGMRRLRHASVPVGCRSLQQMQITWEFRCLHATGITGIKWVWNSENLSELQGIRTITRWPNGRKEAGNPFAPRVKFLPKPGQNCTQRGHVLFGLQEHTVEKPVYRL